MPIWSRLFGRSPRLGLKTLNNPQEAYVKTYLKLAQIAVLATASVYGVPSQMSAGFDSLAPNTQVTSGYEEGGLRFSSTNGFSVVSGLYAGQLFGSSVRRAGNALYAGNDGWVSISAPGSLMSSFSFSYGFAWNFYSIEYGLMDVSVQWEAMLGGQIVASGSDSFDRDNRSHGGGLIEANVFEPFDSLLIRSTAIEYTPVPWQGPNPHQWIYDRGSPIGWGSKNSIAFDDVSVTLTQYAPLIASQVFDSWSSAALLAFGLACVVAIKRRAA